MLSYKMGVIFFVLIILIFIFCTIFLNKISCNENFNNLNNDKIQNLMQNLQLVDKFEKKELKFENIDNPSKEIVKYQTFYESSIFPELSNINYEIVKDEILNYLNSKNNNWLDWPEYDLWKNKNISSSWTVLPLMSFGKWSKKYTDLFPKTTEQLKNINGFQNHA